MQAIGPAAAAIEEAAGRWVLDLLGLPATASFAVRRPAARWRTSPRSPRPATTCSPPAAGTWSSDGLAGAPPVRLLVGDARPRHRRSGRSPARLRAAARLVPVDADERGHAPGRAGRALGESRRSGHRRARRLGEVNMGAMDPVGRDRRRRRREPARGCTSTAPSASGRGQPATPAPPRGGASGPTRGRPTATSGSTSPTTAASRSAPTPTTTARPWASTADYIVHGGGGARPVDWTPEFSRRARGIAALRGDPPPRPRRRGGARRPRLRAGRALRHEAVRARRRRAARAVRAQPGARRRSGRRAHRAT